MFGLSRTAGFCVNHLADAQADAPSSMRAFQAREPAPGESAISVTGSRAGEETTPRPVLKVPLWRNGRGLGIPGCFFRKMRALMYATTKPRSPRGLLRVSETRAYAVGGARACRARLGNPAGDTSSPVRWPHQQA